MKVKMFTLKISALPLLFIYIPLKKEDHVAYKQACMWSHCNDKIEK